MASNPRQVVPIKEAHNDNPLAKLREPFPPNQISKLPKETRAQIDARKADKNLMVWKCPICGGPHHKNAVHLDYVGHAAATDRLLDTDPAWTWEPLSVDQRGLPAFDDNGGLWIKLTVCGVSRLGYGSADGKTGGDAKKEIIGDAIRNAGMRFGMALDLWHKGDLHADEPAAEEVPEVEPQRQAPREKLAGPYTSKTALWTAVRAFDRKLRGCGDVYEFDAFVGLPESQALLEQMERDAPNVARTGEGLPEEFEPIIPLMAKLRTDMLALEEDDTAPSTLVAG